MSKWKWHVRMNRKTGLWEISRTNGHIIVPKAIRLTFQGSIGYIETKERGLI